MDPKTRNLVIRAIQEIDYEVELLNWDCLTEASNPLTILAKECGFGSLEDLLNVEIENIAAG